MLHQKGPAGGLGAGAGGVWLLPFLLSLRARATDDSIGKALTVSVRN